MAKLQNVKNIIIRSETKPNEYRTPIVPSDIHILINNGFNVYVEKSGTRCYQDEDYVLSGAILVESGSWKKFKHPYSLIVGLKELADYQDLDNHNHTYFSHLIKTVNPLLHFFKNSNSIIYDIEYLVDNLGNRKLAFGFYAGYIGALLGLLHYSNELNNTLKPWIEEPIWINKNYLKVVVIGYKGRSGQGALSLLNKYKEYIQIDVIGRDDSKKDLHNYDIIINCIFLNEKIDPFITVDDIKNFTRKTIIVDVSCDPHHEYNPIAIYDKVNTWDNYYTCINSNLAIISLNNLPGLWPITTSTYFSNKFVNLLINMNENVVWNNSYNYYIDALSKINI